VSSRTALAAAAILAFGATALSAQQAPPNLTDPEVAHVAVTANSIDVDAARFALTKTHSNAVKQFANLMITDHTGVIQQASALAQRLHVTPADNAVSQSLQTGARAAHATLQPLSGAAFDRAYIDREVAYHQAVLDAIDTVLIPTTDNAELKQLLTNVRPAVAAHLAHAQQLKTTLMASR
jgi:putative membrane protein